MTPAIVFNSEVNKSMFWGLFDLKLVIYITKNTSYVPNFSSIF